jgi:hypothetical protein
MESYSDTHFSYLHAKVLHEVLNRQQLLGLVIAFAVIVSIIIYLFKTGRDYDDGLFIVNKPWSWEPAFFARLRWITNAQQIITDADKQVGQIPVISAVRAYLTLSTRHKVAHIVSPGAILT